MSFKQFYNNQQLKQQIQQAVSILSDIVNPLGKKMMSAIPKAHDASEQFWSDPKFQHWLQQHGIPVPTEIPVYQDGGAGRAYFVDEEYVIKFTGNPIEANVAKMSANRNDLPTPVIDVLPLGQFYAILEYKVRMGDKIDQTLKDAADWLTLVADDNTDMPGFPSEPKEQEQLIIKTLRENDGPMELLPHMMMVINALATLYRNTGFKHDDAGPTNVGMHKGKIVFPDLGPNQTRDFSADKAMDQIQINRKSLGLGAWQPLS